MKNTDGDIGVDEKVNEKEKNHGRAVEFNCKSVLYG